jgi:hypothetical protein
MIWFIAKHPPTLKYFKEPNTSMNYRVAMSLPLYGSISFLSPRDGRFQRLKAFMVNLRDTNFLIDLNAGYP